PPAREGPGSARPARRYGAGRGHMRPGRGRAAPRPGPAATGRARAPRARGAAARDRPRRGPCGPGPRAEPTESPGRPHPARSGLTPARPAAGLRSDRILEARPGPEYRTCRGLLRRSSLASLRPIALTPVCRVWRRGGSGAEHPDVVYLGLPAQARLVPRRTMWGSVAPRTAIITFSNFKITQSLSGALMLCVSGKRPGQRREGGYLGGEAG